MPSHSALSLEQNAVGSLLVISGLVIPGVELIANACKTLAYDRSNVFSSVLTAASGLIYFLCALPIVMIPGYLSSSSYSSRFIRLLPILVALLVLLWVKLAFKIEMKEIHEGEKVNYLFLALSQCISGLAKRSLLLLGLLQDPAHSPLGRLAHPYLPVNKVKKD